jgi:hypothetical protein
MDSFEIRKNGELVETIVAHEFQMKGKNAVFSIYGEPQTVMALDPGMRVDRVCQPAEYGRSEDNARRYLERLKADKEQEAAAPNVIEFPR